MTTVRRRRRPRPQQKQRSPLWLSCCMLTAAAAVSMPAAQPRSEIYDSIYRGDNDGPARQTASLPWTTPRRQKKDVDVTKLSTRCEDLDYVTGPMDDADADGNGFLSKEEYVTFTDAISGGYLSDSGYDEGFTDMPLSLQETYLVLSCLCELYPNQPWGGKGCCENGDSLVDMTGIRTSGTGEGERPTKQERQYLTYVCGTMGESLEKVGAELVAPPTMTPTEEPTTIMPTDLPTSKPSNRPTPRLTPEPTPHPSKRPTPPPTAVDSNPIPGGTPTENPTPRLTPRPSFANGSPSQSPLGKGGPVRPPITPFPTVPKGSPSQVPVKTNPPTTVDVNPQPGSPTKRPTPRPDGATPEPTPKPTVPPVSPPPSPIEAGTPTKRPSPRPNGVSPELTPKPTVLPGSPSQSPVEASTPTKRPTSKPTLNPSISHSPTSSMGPTASPSVSTSPTISSAPSASPTVTSSPTTSSTPTSAPTNVRYSGDVRATIQFVASLDGKVTAAEVMAGETNQVKVMMEEQLLILSEIVIQEQFRPADDSVSAEERSGATRRRSSTATTSTANLQRNADPTMLRRRAMKHDRELIVKEAVLARVEWVKDIPCPGGVYVGSDPDKDPPTRCLFFNNTIVLSMVNEPHVEEKVDVFEQAMLKKIAEGWLVENFDLQEALQPPPSMPMPPTPPLPTTPSPTPIGNINPGNKNPVVPVDPKPLSAGAIVGIVFLVLACFVIAIFYAGKTKYAKDKGLPPRDHEDDLEMTPDLQTSNMAVAGGNSVLEGDDVTVNTADKSYSSRDQLLPGPSSSRYKSADMSRLPQLGEVSHDEVSPASDDVDLGESTGGGEGNVDASDSEVEESIYSSESVDHIGDVNMSTGSAGLAAMAAASTLVARSHSTSPPRSLNGEMEPSPVSQSPVLSMMSPDDSPDSPSVGDPSLSRGFLDDEDESGSFEAEYNATGLSGEVGARSTRDSDLVASLRRDSALTASSPAAPQAVPQAATAVVGGGGAAGGAAAAAPMTLGEEGGISAGAAAAMGVAGAGLVAAGAYAVTRGPQSPQESVSSSAGDTSSITYPTRSAPSAMDDLDNAIEAGNWGHVGALAAVLASQGHGSHRRSSPTNAANISMTKSTDGDSTGNSGSRSSSSMVGASLDQARAVEIDKLVEAGDWQGVVLAAARFEADQTFDGESSFSASGTSQSSSRWTGSATSATTPRSMATTDRTSASNLSSQRGQAEIRAEVEALVRRVVPEEADNIDEMMTQFKGREEELVETLRRMQERAIASRARLAVQKSAKLEAKAKASPNRSMSQHSLSQSGMGSSSAIGSGRAGSRGSSSHSVTSVSSTKSELEQAIEAGNWQAVGAAAQRMSDQSVGELSMEEVARLREAISQSPAFSRSRLSSGGSPDSDFNLDALIEQGDWTGVIAAAKSASEDRRNQGVQDVQPVGSARGGDGRKRSMMEEQDALAQANMWQEIADQSKQEARQGPAGATDAAAWAIQRSLRALDHNVDAGTTTGEISTGASNATARTIHDIADESDSAGDNYSQYESSSFDDSAGRSMDDYMRSGI